MKEDSFDARCGVLIIGSLLWQDNLGPENNTSRRNWRNNRLDTTSAITVRVPIRYGRLSGGGIYTMTFANSVRLKPGTAFVIPFRENPVVSDNQLLQEARELSAAEGMEGRFIKSTNNIPWSILGILFNDQKISIELKHRIRVCWQTQVEADPDYRFFNHTGFKLGTERSCIGQNGQLNFPWISAVNTDDQARLDEYDFLLATATRPTNEKYPSVTKMVSNVNKDKDRRYFLNNNRSGITTFQDERILKKTGNSPAVQSVEIQ